MVVVQASKLNLPYPSLSSPHITSLLFEPTSLSLALMHSDSTFSLYPSLSPLSLSSLPPPQTLIHPPSSSSTFLLLQNPNNSNPKVLFIVSGPHKGGSQILLRFYVLHKMTQFVRAQVVCTQKDLSFDHKFGALVDCNHGVSVRLSGSVNFFAMYSVSGSKIWVFAVKDVGEVAVKLMRCAVIDCCKPVWSISVSFGFLMLGEDGGVRVFDLRKVAKGRVRKSRTLNGVSGDNVVVHCEAGDCGSKHGSGKCDGSCSGYLCCKNDTTCVSDKQRSVKLKQEPCEDGVYFVAFKGKELETSKPRRKILVKAISLEALSPNKFLILDSDGGLQLLHLSRPVMGSNITTFMQQLPNGMKVQKVAVLPEIAARTQSVWVSDGYNSVQMMVASDMDIAVSENDLNEIKEKPLHITVGLTIFTGEKIQDLTPLATNAILILGQGNLYTYATS
ncbi:uncharacterized protein LOC126800429 isoform X2 [Argentina anserina]|uniref:uncharacterized protein LOC126800429 isoform X2 n=1 Tax=Argentina anserina TaxID=57926 RepID=UPI0021764A43|nr:uncharacterized protein LOC126800429 isoform X2 [Potentilla anserina]